MLQVTLTMDVLCLSVPVSHDNPTVRPHEQYQELEAKWNSAVINLIIYTWGFPTVTCQNIFREENMSWGENRRTACKPHPAGDSSGTPKYALWDQPSKLPHALWLTPFSSPFSLSSSTIMHTAGPKNIPSAVKEQHNTVLFPLLHMW